MNMARKIPYIGGSKSEEKAILRYNQLNVKQKASLLMKPSVKSKRTLKGKYNAMIKLIKMKVI